MFDGAQLRNARTIVRVAKHRRLIKRAAAIGLMTAMQESTLRNLGGGDRDSVGVFQQRPSQGWGSRAQVHDPVYAANRFYDRLVQVPGWQSMPMAQAAQAVQRSADGSLYARHRNIATKLASVLYGHAAGIRCKTVSTPAGSTGVKVVGRALKQLGVPYSWGGGGGQGPSRGTGRGADTVGFDCSGLTQYAWAPWAHLHRLAADQYTDGHRVPLSKIRPGDLVFWAHDTADYRTIHHVAIYLGHGRIVEAPHTGTSVRTRTFSHNETGLMSQAVRPGSRA